VEKTHFCQKQAEMGHQETQYQQQQLEVAVGPRLKEKI
jgi:hypothetical protein